MRKISALVICATALAFMPKVDRYLDILELRAKRKLILDQVGLDVAAVHRATDVINARIERGEIHGWEQLKDAVVNEVAFQEITIRENIQPEA